MSELPVFDIDGARELRDAGISRVAVNNAEFLSVARALARRIAHAKGTVTSDDVRAECELRPAHPNGWGAVFKHEDFVFTGNYRQSAIKSRHGSMQRVWRLKA